MSQEKSETEVMFVICKYLLINLILCFKICVGLLFSQLVRDGCGRDMSSGLATCYNGGDLRGQNPSPIQLLGQFFIWEGQFRGRGRKQIVSWINRGGIRLTVFMCLFYVKIMGGSGVSLTWQWEQSFILVKVIGNHFLYINLRLAGCECVLILELWL